MPETSDWMMSAPSTAPGMVPMPPANDVPPMTAAAMTDSSAPVPQPLVADCRRAVEMTALTAAQDAHDHERPHDDAPGVDARQDRGLGIAADREHVASEATPGREDGHDAPPRPGR